MWANATEQIAVAGCGQGETESTTESTTDRLQTNLDC